MQIDTSGDLPEIGSDLTDTHGRTIAHVLDLCPIEKDEGDTGASALARTVVNSDTTWPLHANGCDLTLFTAE